jgi:hypothetical protein
MYYINVNLPIKFKNPLTDTFAFFVEKAFEYKKEEVLKIFKSKDEMMQLFRFYAWLESYGNVQFTVFDLLNNEDAFIDLAINFQHLICGYGQKLLQIYKDVYYKDPLEKINAVICLDLTTHKQRIKRIISTDEWSRFDTFLFFLPEYVCMECKNILYGYFRFFDKQLGCSRGVKVKINQYKCDDCGYFYTLNLCSFCTTNSFLFLRLCSSKDYTI